MTTARISSTLSLLVAVACGDDVAPVGGGGGGVAGGTPSAVCGELEQGPVGALAQAITVSTPDGARKYNLFVPTDYEPSESLPLVIELHGGGGKGTGMEGLTNFFVLAQTERFMVAAPDGLGDNPAWNGGNECSDASDLGIDDVAFMRAIVADVGSRYCLDTARVYVTGHSSGGRMAHRLGCEAADVFAAIAPNASQIGNLDLSVTPPEETFGCTPSRPVPILQIHGTADCRNLYEGGVATKGCDLEDQSVPATIEAWASRNGCSLQAPQSVTTGDATCVAYECEQDAETVLCTIDGGGHAWPGSDREPAPCGNLDPGTTSQDFQATAEIWKFFKRHSLP